MSTNDKWKEPIYSKKEINNAGQLLRNPGITSAERSRALSIVDNWRAAHAYPLHVLYMNLRRRAESKANVLVVERLKRLDSIVKKLEIEKGMQLYRMQDLGGCRMVLPTLQDVYKYSDNLERSRIRHELKKTNDYIKSPKKSGYRSLHKIYRFYSDTPEKEIYNKYPMLIEVQFRTHLQHIWATAVETMGLILDQAIKSGQGDESIKRFFVVVSSLFAIIEDTPMVPGTSDKQEILVAELKEIDYKTHVLETLRAIRVAINHEANNIPDKKGYFLLRLDYTNHRIKVRHFMVTEFDQANALYDKYETTAKEDRVDVVLVSASSFETVKNAYPNYFMDIAEFISIIEGYLE